MPSLTSSLITGLLAFAMLGGQTAPDDVTAKTRLRLETQRRELLTTVQDKAWMRDTGAATIVRLQIERYWKACADNEALAAARASERPARLLAELALDVCAPWEKALELALQNGAYPYIEGPDMAGRISREDMVSMARLASQDAALARIGMWRGTGGSPDVPLRTPGVPAKPDLTMLPSRLPLSGSDKVAPGPSPSDNPDEEPAIVVTAQPRGGCRVRLADRTLTNAQLAAKAKEWAASGTALKVVRPRGADYRCLAKITWQLGQYGLRLFQFVDASEAYAEPKPAQKPNR